MTYLVVLRYDEAGTCPVILREDDHLFSADGARWRLVAHGRPRAGRPHRRAAARAPQGDRDERTDPSGYVPVNS
jgi:hypothetical protein